MTDIPLQAPTRAAEIREKNERLVLGMIFRSGSFSQSEIAASTGLKAPTVFRIFGELEKSGLIEQVSPPENVTLDRRGRRPTWYSVVPGARRVVGLDFRAGSASVVVVDFSARVLRAEEFPLPPGARAEQVYSDVSKLIRRNLEHPAARGGPVLGIGVGAPGVVDLARGQVIEYPRIPDLAGFPLGSRLAAEFSAPVLMGNNATVAAVASYRYGEHKAASSVFAILIRAGVGGALIRDGKPYESGGRTALEIGHMVIDPDGPLCACGEHGCLEAYLAEENLLNAVSSIMPCEDIAALDALLAAGNIVARQAIVEAAEPLRRTIRSIRHLLEPDAFVIISRSGMLSDMLAAMASETLASMRVVGSAKIQGDSAPIGLPAVSGTVWDPIMAGRAACDMVFDAFFT